MTKRTVLFDMDGLLVDTESLGVEVAQKVCNGLGIELTNTERRNFIGITDKKFYKDLFEKRCTNFDIEETLQRHFDLYEKLLHTNLVAFPGAKELPIILKKNRYNLGLVSGSTRNQIDIILKSLKISDCFDTIVSCDDITSSKPDPEGYLLAAKELNVNPKDCIVLEDAESGIKAAKKAGMFIIGVINNGVQNIKEADISINNLNDLIDLKTLSRKIHP